MRWSRWRGRAARPGQGAARAATPRFWIALGVIVAVAFVVRVTYVLVRLRDEPLGDDSLYYSLQGHDLAHGRWFIEPFRFRFEHRCFRRG